MHRRCARPTYRRGYLLLGLLEPGLAYALFNFGLERTSAADAAVLVTEWPELAELDWAALGETMRRRVFVDGRNMFDPSVMRAAGFVYEGIGRSAE